MSPEDEGLTVEKILRAKRVLDAQSVPTEDRYIVDENGIVQGPFDALPLSDEDAE